MLAFSQQASGLYNASQLPPDKACSKHHKCSLLLLLAHQLLPAPVLLQLSTACLHQQVSSSGHFMPSPLLSLMSL